MFTRSQDATRESAQQKRKRALLSLAIRESNRYHGCDSKFLVDERQEFAVGFGGSWFLIFIVNPALKSRVNFNRPLTRTTPSLTVGLLPRFSSLSKSNRRASSVI